MTWRWTLTTLVPSAPPTGTGQYVTTTSNGTFTVTARVWAMGDSNPALDDDTYTIKVVDVHGFEGEADITIKEPSIMVSPDTASPRDFIVISGDQLARDHRGPGQRSRHHHPQGRDL